MNEPSVSLHQQQGGMTLQAFAELHGMTGEEMRRYAVAGRIVGARQDARSKKWTVFPPAKLIDKAGEPMTKRRKSRAAPPSGAGVMAACGHADTHLAQAVIGAAGPLSAKPVLTLGFAALPGAERKYEHGNPASCGRPEVFRESRRVCQVLREAAARQFREGLHYLRLDAHEFGELYAALSNDRARVRKLVGRGILPVGLLRASDSVWQKMQAMSREGRLL